MYIELGRLYHTQENWPALVDLMTGFTARVMDDYQAYFYLGTGLQGMKKYPEAVAALKKSVELNANQYTPYYNLGQIYLNQEKYKEAYPMFEKAVQLKPDSYKAFYNLAVSYETVYQEDHSKIDQVISYWSKFLKVAKNNPRASSLVAGAEQHLKDLQDLKKTYDAEKTGGN